MYIYRYEKGFIRKLYWSDTFEKYPILAKIFEIVLYPVSLIYSLKIYISNRFIHKIHVLDTGLEKGVYYDLDQRILYACFNEFVKYIENEFIFNFEDTLTRDKKSTEFYINYLNDIIIKRNIRGPHPDSDFYTVVLELYTWWKQSELKFRDDIFSRDYNTDNEMLKKLISIRSALWD